MEKSAVRTSQMEQGRRQSDVRVPLQADPPAQCLPPGRPRQEADVRQLKGRAGAGQAAARLEGLHLCAQKASQIHI